MKFYSGFGDYSNSHEDVFLEKQKPYYLSHEEKPDSIVVCVHGYTASPYESRPVAEEIFRRGFDAVGPVVPAHTLADSKRAKKEMGRVKKEIWINAIEKEVALARKKYEHVYIYGQSMGGALSLIMAEKGLVEACAVTAPAIKLYWFSGLLWPLGWMNINVQDNSAEDRDYYNVSYDFTNIRSLFELLKLSRVARKNLSNITCPVFHCHSKKDDVITPKVAQMVEENVSGPVEVQWFNRSGHTMPLDVQGVEVSKAIGDFFLSLKD